MKRKIVAAVLVIAMVIGMLAGCGAEQGKDKQQSEKEEGNNTQETIGSDGEYYTNENGDQIYKAADGTEYYVDSDGKMYKRFDDVTLSFLDCWEGSYQPIDDQYNSEFSQRLRAKLGITVIAEGTYIDETEKLNMVFSSGAVPDFIELPYWGGNAGSTAAVKKAADDGMLLDIGKYVDDYNYLPQAFEIGNITQAYWNNDLNIWDGSLYVMPAHLKSAEENSPSSYAICVRQDVAETLEIDPLSIRTPEELYDFMKAAQEYGFKDVNGNDTITLGTFGNGSQFWLLFRMFSDKRWTDYLVDEDGNVNNMYLDEGYCIEGTKYIWRLMHEGIMDKECLTQSQDLGKEKAGNGSVLFIAARYDTAINATMASGLYDTNPEMRYIPVGPIAYRDGDTMKTLESRGAEGSHAYVISEECSNPEAVLTLIDYISSPEGWLLQNGVEGEDYTWDGKTDGTGFAWTEECLQKYTEDQDAYNADRNARGYGISDLKAIVRRQTEWFGDTSKSEENEYYAAYKEMVPVEFPEHTLITEYFSGYEKSSEAIAIFNEAALTETLFPALFADTEDECVKMMRDWQDKLKSNEVYSGFLQYLTDCYKADPDNISF